ncbi:MAG: lysine transporter LysE [Frankiales bacterium]|nr:lysine transporter LysE [Frankiales bacterium]
MITALLAFALAAAVLVMLPGPDSMLMLRAIAVSGRAGAIRTAAGILTGLVVWITSASIGLAALLKASEIGYTTLRVVGAIYLFAIGIQALRARGALQRSGLLGTGYTAGIACNLFNPKVGVFFVTFLPGLVPRGADVGTTSLMFGAIFIVETLIYFAVMLLAVERLTAWLRDDVVRRRIERLSGVVLIAFGIRLAVEA